MPKFIQLDKDGLLEEVDLESGVVAPLEKSLHQALADAPLETHNLVRGPKSKLVLTDKHASPQELLEISANPNYRPYSTLLALQICERVVHGEKLTEVCEEDDMPPYGQLCRWRREHPEFGEWLTLARQDRAELFFDKALSAVENADKDRDSISLARLRSDFYKAAAKVSNPDVFGDKKEAAVNVNVGSFQLETGIRRVGDSGFNEDEALKLIKEIEGK